MGGANAVPFVPHGMNPMGPGMGMPMQPGMGMPMGYQQMGPGQGYGNDGYGQMGPGGYGQQMYGNPQGYAQQMGGGQQDEQDEVRCRVEAQAPSRTRLSVRKPHEYQL